MTSTVEQRGSAIIRRLPRGSRVVEVGVLIGALSEFILKARPDVHLIMVDSWETASEWPEAYKATGDIHAIERSREKVSGQRARAERRVKPFAGRYEILPMRSLHAAAQIPDNSLDLVFLDADHSYDGVKADLAAWVPKVRAGGWIGGHDYMNHVLEGINFTGVERAVDEWAEGRSIELDENFTWFCRC